MDETTQLCEGEEFIGDDVIVRFEPPMEEEDMPQQVPQQTTTVPDPEIVDAEVLMNSSTKGSDNTNTNEKKSLWFKIVSILGVIFTALIGLPKETKKMIAKTIVDSLDKKNEEKKRRLAESVTPVETT